MTSTQTSPDVEDFLAHFGVKGMKWGQRKSESGGSSTGSDTEKAPRWTPEQKKAAAKKVAIGTGILAAAVGSAYLAKNAGAFNSIKVSSLPAPKPEVKKTAARVIDQVEVMHASRAKNKGFTFVKNGGFPDPLAEYEKAFGANAQEVGIRKLDDGRVAATFLDPSGRKDFAGRAIPHQVLVPRNLSEGINTLADVQDRVWPLVRDQYQSFYDANEARRA